MDEELNTIDLRIPADCRKLLENIQINGSYLTKITVSTGEVLLISTLSDEQAIQYANQLHRDLFNRKTEFDSHLWEAEAHA